MVATLVVAASSKESTHRRDCGLKQIAHYRAQTQLLRDIMGVKKYAVAYQERKTRSCAFKQWIGQEWERRYKEANRLFHNPPMLSAWLCIHSHEASWTDPNPPYYGGLQMDLGFQQTYASDLLSKMGTADHWTPLQQIWVAYKAYRSGRGFYPWPNTARYCGLI